MKIRIFANMDNSVLRVVVNTEDFSQEDLKLMRQYGEPEVNVGGDVEYVFGEDNVVRSSEVPKSQSSEVPKSQSSETHHVKHFGDQYVRILHGFPFAFGFDSRDYDGATEEAMAVGGAWTESLIYKISTVMDELRDKSGPLPTEEVVNI